MNASTINNRRVPKRPLRTMAAMCALVAPSVLGTVVAGAGTPVPISADLAALQEWVDLVADPAFANLVEDQDVATSCNECAQAGPALEQDAVAAQKAPTAPDGRLEAAWLAVLKRYYQIGSDLTKHKLSGVTGDESALISRLTDMKSLEKRLGVIDPATVDIGTGGPGPVFPTTTTTTAPPTTKAPPPKPLAVLSATASPDNVGPGGGTVSFTGHVRTARTCHLKLLSRQSFPVVYSANTRPCSKRDFTARIGIGPNPSAVVRTIAFALIASNGRSNATRRFYVTMAGAFPARVLSVGATPRALGHGGGTVIVRATIEHALSCRLRAVSSESLGLAYSAAPRPCGDGRFKAEVAIGGNTSHDNRTLTFELDASNKTSSSSRLFHVTVKGTTLLH